MKIPKNIKRYRIERAKGFRLADIDPADTGGLAIDKDEAKDILAKDIKRLAELQELLYAEHRWALLVIFQAMDAGGKDSAIAHVMSGVNPQGCDVHAFKRPTTVPCGAGGQPCCAGNTCGSVPNGTASCTGGTCTIGSCNAGFADCDFVLEAVVDLPGEM